MAGGIEDYAVDVQPNSPSASDWTGFGGAAGSLAGAGLQAFGTMQQVGAAKQEAGISRNIAGLEQQQNAQRAQAMELTARRSQMEVLRSNQMARSMAVNNATNQGAQFGSGLQGGLGQISGASGTNLLGINQNLGIGRSLFSLSNQISTQKMAMADAQSQAASGQGLSSLGGVLGKSGGAFAQVAQFALQAAPALLL